MSSTANQSYGSNSLISEVFRSCLQHFRTPNGNMMNPDFAISQKILNRAPKGLIHVGDSPLSDFPLILDRISNIFQVLLIRIR